MEELRGYCICSIDVQASDCCLSILLMEIGLAHIIYFLFVSVICSSDLTDNFEQFRKEIISLFQFLYISIKVQM